MPRNSTARVKAPAADFQIPRDLDEANDFVGLIGSYQRERICIEARMNDALAKLKADYDEEARPFKERIEQRAKGLQTYCEANRALLTRDGHIKTHRFGLGEISWRLRPPSVAVRNVKNAIEWLRRHGPKIFLREKFELNKDAMRDQCVIAAKVPGVKVGSAGEDFVIKPFETELEEVAS